MLEDILDSKIKIKIAKLFVDRNETFQVSDVARILKISKSRASECLKEFAEKGVLESRIIGRSVLYKLASSSLAKTVYNALTQEKFLLSEIENSVLEETKKLKPINLSLFGSALKGLKIGSDVDFLLLYNGIFGKGKIYEVCGKLTEFFGFRVSILAMNVEEFRLKVKKGEEFVINILANHKLLYGKDLEDLVWQEK